MSYAALQNLRKISHDLISSISHRGFKIQLAGVIPGGGLGKLQGMAEEEYFTRKDQKLCEMMKEKLENLKLDTFISFDYENTYKEHPRLKEFPCKCSLRHKNIREEGYFLADHCDCLQLLATRFKNEENLKDTNETEA